MDTQMKHLRDWSVGKARPATSKIAEIVSKSTRKIAKAA
jgi:hypothetical protein